MISKIFLALTLSVISFTNVYAHGENIANVKVVFDQPLPNVPGKSIKGVLVEYAPGGASPSHTHAASAFIYATVLEGEVLSGLNGGPVQKFKAGESFYEKPGDFHDVSANASETESAKLLAVFVVDSDDENLTTFVKD